jgi:serine-type D-Ala-D-Ala carboxypeptidase/endopeptidase
MTIRRALSRLSLAFLFGAGPLPLMAQSAVPDSALKAVLQERVTSKRAVGLVVVTVEKGKPPQIYTEGTSGSAFALDGNTVFEIGSVSKVFTTAILAGMVRRGEVRLDDPISKYLPATVKVPSRAGKQITLLDLATQSSGLPRLPNNMHPANIANPYADYSVQQLYDFLSSYELTRDIGSRFEYSNLGVGLLGHVLSLRAGKSYEALVTERILEPLGMHDTRITLSPTMAAHLAPGHNDAGAVVANWDLPTLAGAGALRSTPNDMAKFLAANLDSTLGPVAGDLARAHTAVRDTDQPAMRIGLAWLTLNPFGTPITWHNGGTGGYHSFIGFDPTHDRGVVILANSSRSIDDIGLHTLEPRIPLSVVTAAKVRTEIAIDPAKLDAYVGVYELAPTFSIAITKEGGALFGQATGQTKFQLFPETETDFFFKVTDAQITFVRDAAGKIDSIVLHQSGANTPGKRIK